MLLSQVGAKKKRPAVEGWWLSGCRNSVAESTGCRGVLGSIPSDCWPFHIPLFHLKISQNFYKYPTSRGQTRDQDRVFSY